jgi:hypothetical protein
MTDGGCETAQPLADPWEHGGPEGITLWGHQGDTEGSRGPEISKQARPNVLKNKFQFISKIGVRVIPLPSPRSQRVHRGSTSIMRRSAVDTWQLASPVSLKDWRRGGKGGHQHRTTPKGNRPSGEVQA